MSIDPKDLFLRAEWRRDDQLVQSAHFPCPVDVWDSWSPRERYTYFRKRAIEQCEPGIEKDCTLHMDCKWLRFEIDGMIVDTVEELIKDDFLQEEWHLYGHESKEEYEAEVWDDDDDEGDYGVWMIAFRVYCTFHHHGSHWEDALVESDKWDQADPPRRVELLYEAAKETCLEAGYGPVEGVFVVHETDHVVTLSQVALFTSQAAVDMKFAKLEFVREDEVEKA
ncbi:hypothetical protein [Leptothrix discophora]|uniref:Uncharacterized protein n=1 Tax=Leptothrix discophora TaxID=89 RepID=A0ABT9G0J6_LEPDI|nr:hypothetical protein [Leptothrix discophora]MDP4299955.1 hypothetical protein [Leptothrix discophora]